MPATERYDDEQGIVTVSSSHNGGCTVDQSASVVICHGLGGTAESFVHIVESLADQMPHIKFILPTAPTQPVTKLPGKSMPSWYDIVGLDERSNEACKGIDHSVDKIRTILSNEHENTGIPYSRMVLGGFSQGGALSLFAGMQLDRADQKLAGVLVLSGYLPCAERFKVTQGLESTPILHLHGESDSTVPYTTAQASRQRSVERGATRYEVRGYPGLGHSVSPEEIRDVINFLREVLPLDGKCPCATKVKDCCPSEDARNVGVDKKKLRAARSRLISIVALLVLAGIAVIVSRATVGRSETTTGSYSRDNSETDNPVPVLEPEQIRFNKFSLLTAEPPDDPFCSTITQHLSPNAYPISGSPNATSAQCMLKNHTDAVSVVAADDWECRKLDVEELIAAVGGAPSQPLSVEVGDYWDRLEKVIDVQKIRLKRGEELSRVALPDFPLPYRWVEFTVNEVAGAVHDEYPGLHQSNLISDLMTGTYGQIEIDASIIPQRARVQLLRGIFMLAELNQWAIGRVGPYNFAAKWHVGRARPEEMVSAIQSGTLSYVPPNIQKKVKELPWTSRAPDFTAYPEGAPRHPSWPAMHGAASGLSFWLSIVLNLTPQQHCQAKLVDHAVAWARTVAGVHYEDDNIAGLDMGQEVVARLLPEHLANTYGANLVAVQAKVEAMRFSWREFDMKNPCPGTEWMLWRCKSRRRRCTFPGVSAT